MPSVKNTHKKLIMVIGSVNIDHCLNVKSLPKPGETIAGNGYAMLAGGKGANQAVTCARLGSSLSVETQFLANVGDDAIGHSLVENFESEGIDTSMISFMPEQNTGVALIFVDAKAENCIGISAGANATLDTMKVDRYREQIERADYLLMQLETPLDAISAAAKIANGTGTLVFLNPAPARVLPDEFLNLVDVITPNETEAEAITGIKVTDLASARLAANQLHGKGINKVIITMGSLGAFYSDQRIQQLVRANQVKAVDTTAAGDTFNGAYLIGLSTGLNDISAIEFANHCAGIAVTRPGAQTSIPQFNEVAACYEDIKSKMTSADQR